MKLSDFKKVKPRTFVTEKGTEVKCIFWCVLKNGWEYYFIDAETNTEDIVFAYVLGHENEYGDVSLSEIRPYIMGRCYNRNDLYEIAPPDDMTWKEESKKKDNPVIDDTPKEIITGGRADNIPESHFDKTELNRGIKVEMEHTNNTSIAKEIAKDHLVEDPQYYEKLSKIHKEQNPKKLPHSGTVVFTFSDGSGDIMAVDGKIYPFTPEVVCELSKKPKKGDKVKFSLYENLYSSMVDYLIVVNERENKLKPIKEFLKKDNPTEQEETCSRNVPYGFKSFTGVVWTNEQVDEYNRLANRIKKSYEEKGTCSVELINASHKLFSMFSLIDDSSKKSKDKKHEQLTRK